MAKLVLKDASITVGGTNLSDHISSIAIPVEADAPESTAFGATWRERAAGGLKDFSVDITWQQDYAAANVDATLWPLLATSAAIVVKPTSGAVSATNPSYSGSVIVNQLTPVNGSVGDLAGMTTSWPANGALTRAVA